MLGSCLLSSGIAQLQYTTAYTPLSWRSMRPCRKKKEPEILPILVYLFPIELGFFEHQK
jgi:hypothetical protein